MELNDIAVRPAKRQVSLGDGTTYTYGWASCPAKDQSIRRTVVLRAPPISNTVWPGKIPRSQPTTDIPVGAKYAF